MIVADSSVWIDHFRGTLSPQVLRLRSLDIDDDIIVGDVIALEVLRGARTERQAAAFRDGFDAHGVVPMLNAELANLGAAHYRRLRGLGITVRKLGDLIIATFCIVHEHDLLHQDRDFDPFETHLGLKVVHAA